VKRLFNLFKSFISECEAYAIAFIIIIGIHLSVLIDWLRILFLDEFYLLKLTKNLYLNNKEKEKRKMKNEKII
jgi:hypothetical protein